MDEVDDPKIPEVPSEVIEEQKPEEQVLDKVNEVIEPPTNLVEFFERNPDAIQTLHEIKTVVVDITQVPLKEINDLVEHVGKFGYRVVKVLHHPREYQPEKSSS